MLAGVDGCRAGWLAVTYYNGCYGYGLYPHFKDFLKSRPELKRILIDIPIGLSSPGFPRTVDALLRKELPGRGSTVFNVPCRDAVYESDKSRARAANIRVEGKSLSVQSLNICGKIKDVDTLLPLKNGPLLLESHPEAGFKSLNRGKVLLSKKNTPRGREERLSLLENADIAAGKAYRDMLKAFKMKDAKPDDLLDALCLCVINRSAADDRLGFIEDRNNRDEKGVPIRIALLTI